MSAPNKIATLREAGFMCGVAGHELERLALAAGEKLEPPYDLAELQSFLARCAAKGLRPRSIHI